jgi:hypothetical protein
VTASPARHLLAVVSLLAACGGDDLVLPGAGEPAAIRIAEGDGQSGRVGDPLAAPIIAEVADVQGRPVVDAVVSFVFLTESGATAAPATAATGADGRAAFEIVLGPTVGPVSAEARVPTAGGSQTLSAPVSLTALPLDANQLHAVSGDSQSAPVGAALADPLVVQVTDAFGNPAAGVAIAWAADGGGAVSEASTVTGDDGLTSVERTLGETAGIQHTVASAPGLAGSPLTFTHMATAGAAASLAAVSGDGQGALVGTPLPQPLVVRALDGAGNPVAGLPITWVVGEGGGTVTPATTTTDAAGLAATQWTLGPSPGRNTATAVLSGVGTVGFTATGTPGTPPGITIETQPPARAARGAVLDPAPVVQLREPDGSPRDVSGVAVTVTLVQSGASLGGTRTQGTGSDGRASFGDLTLAGPPGSYTLAFSATGYAGVRSSAVTLTRAATTTTIQADDPDPSVAGADVRVRFVVQSAGGTPAGQVQVRADDGSSCSGSVAAGECTIRPTSPGTRTLTATFAGSGEFEGSSDTESHTVQAPAPSVLAFRTAPPATAVAGVALAPAPVIQLVTATGGEVHTSGVAVTVSLLSGTGQLGGTLIRQTDGDGRAGFTDLVITGATGPHTLQFAAPGFTSVASDPIVVSPPAPAATTTTITSDTPDPSDPGAPVAVQFTVAAAGGGSPTGLVTVTASGGTESCTGQAPAGSCSITLTVSGTRTLTASYAGGDGFAASSGTEPHTVSQPAPVPSASTSTVEVKSTTLDLGQSTDVTVTVRDAASHPIAGETVALTASGGGTTITPASATTDNKGEARFSFSADEAGTKQLQATVDGVVIDQQPTITVNQAATTTRITGDDPDPSLPGEAVTVTFTVESGAGAPSGTVTVTGGGQSCTGSAPAGSCTLAFTAPGTVTITAGYGGADNFAPSSADASHQVDTPPPPALSLSTQPSSSAVLAVPFDPQPVVQLRSASGDPLPLGGVAVTAQLASGAGLLTGTAVATTDASGRAAFDNLAVVGLPGSYTLRFTASGYTDVVSDPITVALGQTATSATAAPGRR